VLPCTLEYASVSQERIAFIFKVQEQAKLALAVLFVIQYIQDVRDRVRTYFKHFCWESKQLREYSFHHIKRLLRKFPPPPPFYILLHVDLSLLCCSHNAHPVFKLPETDACVQPSALDRTSIVRKTSAVPLVYGENHTLVALLIFSVKMFKICAHCISHPLHELITLLNVFKIVVFSSVLITLYKSSITRCHSQVVSTLASVFGRPWVHTCAKRPVLAEVLRDFLIEPGRCWDSTSLFMAVFFGILPKNSCNQSIVDWNLNGSCRCYRVSIISRAILSPLSLICISLIGTSRGFTEVLCHDHPLSGGTELCLSLIA
jgi:hypothetical protein